MSPIFTWRQGSMFLAGSIISVGVFDGVHLGHRELIAKALKDARKHGAGAYVLTFDKDPDEFFKEKEDHRKLLSNADRINLLSSLGADGIIVIPFDEKVATVSPQDSLAATMTDGIAPLAIHVGKDFCFGYKRAGNAETIIKWAAKNNCDPHFHELLLKNNKPVSSTRIRDALENSDIELANELLGRPHFIRAKVVEGRGVGTGLGFSTANLSAQPSVTTIGEGVYAGYVKIHGTLYKAAIAVGPPKTFNETVSTIEAHILDFDSNIYSEDVEAYFVSYLRPMIKFDSFDELIKTVNNNIEWVRNNLNVF